MPLIVIGLIAWVVTKAITDGRIDHTYARQGLVSPRLQAKYGSDTAAREETAGYGLFGHIRAAWLDYWPRRTEALKAARDAKATNPGERVRLRDQLAAAKRVVVGVGRKLVEPVPTKAERQPAEVVEEKPAEPAPALAVETGDVDPGTVRITDDGREQWDGAEWQPVPEPTAADDDTTTTTQARKETQMSTRTPVRPCANGCGKPRAGLGSLGDLCADCAVIEENIAGPEAMKYRSPISDADAARLRVELFGLCARGCGQPVCEHEGQHGNGLGVPSSGALCCYHEAEANQQRAKAAGGEPGGTVTTTIGGPSMTAPMEATNFETAVPALDALTQAAQNLSDHVAGAEAAAAQFNDQVNEIDQDRRAVEEAATAVMEQLAARNLDADTMGQVTAAMEQIRAGDLSKAMDYIDAAMTSLSGAKTAAVEASGAAAAASQTVVAKYGDAASTVASELSGDASFLHSGGGAAGGSGGGSGAAGAPAGGSGGGIHATDGDISYTGVLGGGGGGGSLAGVGAGKPSGPMNSGVQHFGTGEINFGEGSVIGDHATVNNG